MSEYALKTLACQGLRAGPSENISPKQVLNSMRAAPTKIRDGEETIKRTFALLRAVGVGSREDFFPKRCFS